MLNENMIFKYSFESIFYVRLIYGGGTEIDFLAELLFFKILSLLPVPLQMDPMISQVFKWY